MPEANVLFCFPVFPGPPPYITKHFLVKQANNIGIQDFVCPDCLYPCSGTRNTQFKILPHILKFNLDCIRFKTCELDFGEIGLIKIAKK